MRLLSQKNPSPKRAGGVAQGKGPEFKPQYHKKEKKKQQPIKQTNKQKTFKREESETKIFSSFFFFVGSRFEFIRVLHLQSRCCTT
jgi:ribosomal protein RSM22 (predicted rRNA methylase)